MSLKAVQIQFRSTWISTTCSFILLAGITYFVVWAEKQTIATSLALDELLGGATEVRDIGQNVDGYDSTITSQYEGRIVHVVGPLRVLEPITEPDYMIQVQAVKLRRRVQMYQWIEEVSEDDGFVQEPSAETPKTYWYHKDWRDYVVDSSIFNIRPGHQNPVAIPLASETHIADNVKIGAFYLGMDLKRKVNDFYVIWSDARPERGDIKLHSGFYYHGESALQHEIGDLRVTFTYAGREDDIYTAVGIVEKSTIQSYQTSAEGSDPISILRKGSFPLEQLTLMERREQNLHVWKYRAMGFIQVFAAIMTLHPDWLTLFLHCRWLSQSLKQSSRLWVNLVLTTSYTLFIIACPWLIHKPSYGIMVVCCAALPLLHYSTLLTRNNEQNTNPPWRTTAS